MNDSQQTEGSTATSSAPIYKQVSGTKGPNNNGQPRQKKTPEEKAAKLQKNKEEVKEGNGPQGKNKEQRKGSSQQKKNGNNKGGKKQQQQKATLDLNAPTFVFGSIEQSTVSAGIGAGFPQLITQSATPPSSNHVFNVDAPVFKPKSTNAGTNNSGTPSLPPNFNLQMVPTFTPQQPTIGFLAAAGQLGAESISGYKNPFAKNPSHGANSTIKQALPEKPPVSRIYDLEFMMSLRAANKDRPVNMALLDFPHKKKRQMKTQGDQMTEADKFNHTVRELRILLNKISKDNFDNVTKHILNDYTFTPALLNELMKIIFMKATTENAYLELYVRLCILLFRKYNDKENVEMNFKKLLLSKCQKQF